MIKDYHNLYSKCDVLNLADMFENSRNSSLKFYDFCPGPYVGAAASSCDAMLSTTQFDLELCFRCSHVIMVWENCDWWSSLHF